MVNNKEFPSIDEVHEMLDEIAEDIPKEFYRELNGGIILIDKHKLHPESQSGYELYVKGEYIKDITGRYIKIYYGSFKKLYIKISKKKLYKKLEDTLLHEFTHHLEDLAGERGLEIKDIESLNRYRSKHK